MTQNQNGPGYARQEQYPTNQQRQPQTQLQPTKEEWEMAIREELTKELVDHADALPEGMNKERFVVNAMAVVKSNSKDLSQIYIPSIVHCLAKGAYLGLDFLNKECYAIPYKGKLSFQTDYKGEIKLAKKYSRKKITDIYAKNVRKGDDFEEVIRDGRQSINFKPVPFSDEEIIGSFAVVLYEDGSMIYDTMSAKEIEHTRASYSKAQNSPTWRNSPGEMYKKTVLRRLVKMVDLEFDSSEQAEAFSAGSGADFNQTTTEKVAQAPGMMNDQVVDVFAEEIPDVQEEW